MNNVEDEIKNDYKKHICDAFNEQSQKMLQLYAWCQLNHSFWTQDVEPFDDIAKAKQMLDALVEKYK